MPTENERKYVLHRDCDRDWDQFGFNHVTIQQGYLAKEGSTSVRVRSSFHSITHISEYTMTVKSKSNGRVIEVEQQIDDRDFDDLFALCRRKLKKIRCFVQDWELDFFLDQDNSLYFILAEIEMPEGQTEPESIPQIVKKHLIHEVPIGDDRFSSRKLANQKYATKLWRSLQRTAGNH